MVVIGIACLAGSTMPCENNNVGRPSNDATYKYGRKSISQWGGIKPVPDLILNL